MHKGRLEAFTDGVIAIILTIMVLEMKVPHGATLDALMPIWPVFLSYILSFVYVGTYWTNHHHLLQATQKVTGGILMANLNLLFWLSLLPFTTGWMGENHFAQVPVALYGVNLLLVAISYYILQSKIVAIHDTQTWFREALGRDLKGKGSILAYIAGIVTALAGYPLAGVVVLVGVAIMWVIPDRRMEWVIESRGARE